MNWNDFINKELSEPYMVKLRAFIEQERKYGNIFPGPREIFGAFQYFDPEQTRVVIIGQDPYPTKGDAHGLAFSSLGSKRPYSLQIIFKELYDSYSEMDSKLMENEQINYLASWANQGVLLLNTVLTVREGKPKSHAGVGWETFTQKVIDYLLSFDKQIIWCLWGKDAQKTMIGKVTGKNIILMADHPAATRYGGQFLGCKHFLLINQLLVENNEMPINWSLYPKDATIKDIEKHVPMFEKYSDYEVWKAENNRKLFFVDKQTLLTQKLKS